MKKIISIGVLICTLFAMCACGTDTSQKAATNDGSALQIHDDGRATFNGKTYEKVTEIK